MQNDYLSSSLLLSCEYRRILSDFQMLKFESNKQTNKLAVNNSTEWTHTTHTQRERTTTKGSNYGGSSSSHQ